MSYSDPPIPLLMNLQQLTMEEPLVDHEHSGS
jgi:hypothetical protein